MVAAIPGWPELVLESVPIEITFCLNTCERSEGSGFRSVEDPDLSFCDLGHKSHSTGARMMVGG